MSLGHVAAGYFVAVASERRWPDLKATHHPWLKAFSILCALTPDLDILISWVRGDGIRHCLPGTHSIFLFAALTIPMAALLRKQSYLPSYLLFLLIAGGISHLVLDFISHGVIWLYPFDDRVYTIWGITILESYGESSIIQPFFFLELASVVCVSRHMAQRIPRLQRIRWIAPVSSAAIGVLVVIGIFWRLPYGG